jgi:hypothetical protein
MKQIPLLPCPKCMGTLAEEGLMDDGGDEVAREMPPQPRTTPPGVRYQCSHCGTPLAIAFRQPIAG